MEVETRDGSVDQVRLLAVDAPETTGPNDPREYGMVADTECLDHWGQRAAQFAAERLPGQWVTLVLDTGGGREPGLEELVVSGRLLVFVEWRGEDYNALLVERGLARLDVDTPSSRDGLYLELQGQAPGRRRRPVGLPEGRASRIGGRRQARAGGGAGPPGDCGTRADPSADTGTPGDCGTHATADRDPCAYAGTHAHSGAYADPCANAGTHTDAGAHADPSADAGTHAHPGAYRDPSANAGTHAHARAHGDPSANAGTYAHSGAYADPRAYAGTHAHSGAHSHAGTYAHPGAHGNACADAHANAGAQAQRRLRSGPGRHQYGFSLATGPDQAHRSCTG